MSCNKMLHFSNVCKVISFHYYNINVTIILSMLVPKNTFIKSIFEYL